MNLPLTLQRHTVGYTANFKRFMLDLREPSTWVSHGAWKVSTEAESVTVLRRASAGAGAS